MQDPPEVKKREYIREYEAQIQKFWAESKIFELDATDGKEHWLGTFPYPYMNGVLHLGHAFTCGKVDMAAGYWRIKGVNALYPFGFHCTGMPIKAASDTLSREMEKYGNPPQFPPEEATEVSTNQSKKAAAKSGSKFQWQIMEQSSVPPSEIPKFSDANYWLKYFPPLAKEHLIAMGAKIDWRRSFITTDVNPFYDKFVQWQFWKLKHTGKIKFGRRPTIYSPKDGQPCMDHDRYDGEGVGVAEYTIIKQELLKPYPPVLSKLESDSRTIYMVPATLRPETMYGQTNCWVLPDGEYGAFAINDKEIFVCTKRAARNFSFQEKSPVNGVVTELATFQGSALLGAALRAPLSKYPVIYVLPMHTISADKTTGVVTSVPSDSPDDLAAFRDIKRKRANYGIKDECVLPFEVVPIIEVPEFGTTSAVTVVDQLKIKSQNDKDALVQAKDMVYAKGFYEGVLLVGEHAGKKVQVAKPLIRDELIRQGLACKYYEPESRVISRSMDECVVALCDQWYLDYGEPQWKSLAVECLEKMETFGDDVRNQFKASFDWIHQWACSRSYGLGTRIPWDLQYLIESLSDSTIYMAYYCISHLLQNGVFDGSVLGPFGVKPEELTNDVFEYIYGEDSVPVPSTPISKEFLEKARKEFRSFYPVKLRASGKDLIPNHLVFWIYNHVALFPKQFWPTGVKAGGWLNLNNDKMSKRTGNFITLKDAIRRYSADGMRFALSEAGDTLADSNFTTENADNAILRIHTQVEWIKEILASESTLKTGPPTTWAEKIFDAQIDRTIISCDKFYQQLLFREVTVAYYDLMQGRDFYRAFCAASGVPMNSDLLIRFIRVTSIIMAPIISHTSEHTWKNLLKLPGSVFQAGWPTVTRQGTPEQQLADIQLLIDQYKYVDRIGSIFRGKVKEYTQPKKKKGEEQKVLPLPSSGRVYVAARYPQWHEEALILLKKIYKDSNGKFPENKDISAKIREAGGILEKNMAKVMALVTALKGDITTVGENEAFSLGLPFNEKDLVTEILPFLKSTLQISNITVHFTTDTGIPETEQQLQSAQPGRPLIFFSA